MNYVKLFFRYSCNDWDYNKKTALKFFYYFKKSCFKINDGDIFEAFEFKLVNKSKKLSYADCLGYITAMNNNMKFLTGDKEFENFKNVEFVK